MASHIKLSTEAAANLRLITNYIASEFGEARALRFTKDILHLFKLIGVKPHANPIYTFNNEEVVRRKVFQKRTIILYLEMEDVIEILTIADARSNWQNQQH